MDKGRHEADPKPYNTENMKTEEIANRTLTQKNWTGLTLAELIEAGRIQADSKEVQSWIIQANGQAENLDHLKLYKEAAILIAEKFAIA